METKKPKTTLNNLQPVKDDGQTKRLWTLWIIYVEKYFLKKEKQNVDQQKHSPLLLQPRVHCGAHVYLSHHIACYPESLNSNLMFFFFLFLSPWLNLKSCGAWPWSPVCELREQKKRPARLRCTWKGRVIQTPFNLHRVWRNVSPITNVRRLSHTSSPERRSSSQSGLAAGCAFRHVWHTDSYVTIRGRWRPRESYHLPEDWSRTRAWRHRLTLRVFEWFSYC